MWRALALLAVGSLAVNVHGNKLDKDNDDSNSNNNNSTAMAIPTPVALMESLPTAGGEGNALDRVAGHSAVEVALAEWMARRVTRPITATDVLNAVVADVLRADVADVTTILAFGTARM